MSELSEKPQIPSQDVSDPVSLHTVCSLTCFYSVAVMWGFRSIYHDQPSPLDLLVPLALGIILGMWSVVDARKRRYRIPMFAQAGFFFLYGIVVPGYLIWSRGWRGLGWAVLHFCAWYLVVAAAWFLGGLAIFGEAWLQALGL